MKEAKEKQKNLQPKTEGISIRGKKVIFGGILLLVLGYFVLTMTDPAGQNWASKLAPFLIIGGYAVIGIGIIYPKAEIIGKEKNT